MINRLLDNSDENYVGLLSKLDFTLTIISQNKYIAYGPKNIIYSYPNCLASLYESCAQIMTNSDILGNPELILILLFFPFFPQIILMFYSTQAKI